MAGSVEVTPNVSYHVGFGDFVGGRLSIVGLTFVLFIADEICFSSLESDEGSVQLDDSSWK